MYWYYKVPLVVIAVLLGFGVCTIVWRSLPKKVTQTVSGKIAEPFSGDPDVAPVNDAGGTDTDDTSGPPQEPDPVQPSADTDDDPVAGTPVNDAPPSQTPHAVMQLLDAAEVQFQEGNYLASRQLGMKALAHDEVVRFDRAWFDAADVINRINSIFMSSETANPERKAYTVQPGDSLSRISVAFNTSVGALQRINDLDPTNPIIYPGSVLYILEATWSIRVSKSQYVLLLYRGSDLYRIYRVGIGKQNKTPVGTFTINSKVIHPAWTPPGRNFPFGDPENPLGTHWLGLKPTPPTDATLRGYGIHGTWEPDTIGTGASRGCIRMRNDDISELFDFMPEPGPKNQISVSIED